MLQDFERGRSTEIDFVNGYVVGLGKQNGMNVVINEVIVAIVKAIVGGDSSGSPECNHREGFLK